MVFPLEADELIKNLLRDRINQVAQLPGNGPEKPTGECSNTISFQQIQEGKADLFHPENKLKMSKDNKK